jgi:peptidoglycan/LPS O-acetylase OafA/YrhL
MRFLGRISYSFYLLHFLGLTVIVTMLKERGLINRISPLYYWMVVCGIGIGTIIVCAFSYQWLEHPFLHVGQEMRRAKLPGEACRSLAPDRG